MTRRSRILSFGAAAVLVVLGAVGAVAFSSTLGQVVAMVLIGVGLILATALVFLEVGLSEDRERARAAKRAEREAAPSQASHGPGPKELQGRRRLRRMRGSRRRLE
jgi:heme A synthase